MKIKYAGLILLLGASFARATSVTATITDTDSQTWNNGNYSISLVNPRPDIVPNINGVALTNGQVNLNGALNGSGVLSVTLTNTDTISPAGTTWSFTICPNASSPCGTGQHTVTGSSLSLSVFLSSIIKAPRFSAISGSYGYSDVEVAVIPSNGAMYYNVTTGLKTCSLSGGVCTWSVVGGGGSPYNPATVAITGGTINGTTIGATTPAAVTGTTVISTGKFIAPSGFGLGYFFSGDTSSGIFEFAPTFLGLAIANVPTILWGPTKDVYGSGQIVGFNSLADVGSGSCDVAFTRAAAGSITVGDCSAVGGMTATLQSGVTTADPGCTTTAHVGKLWFNTTTTTTVLKVCMNVAGTLTWVTK